MQTRRIFKVVVSVKLEYRTVARNIEEAKNNIENVELPKEYVEDSFELESITPLQGATYDNKKNQN